MEDIMHTVLGIHEDAKLADAVRELALEDYKGPRGAEFPSRREYRWLIDAGSRLWLDTGDAEAAASVWSSESEALTTNNTLVNQVVQTGMMDDIIGYGARRIRDIRPDISEQDLIIEIAFLVNARLALSLVQRFGAHVSVELHPDTSFDVAATLAFARRYYEINPDFFYVKVPLTPDGFIATRILSAEGIPVNYTLGFSARQNYLAARFSRPRFVNVFLGRLNQLVEENRLGKPQNIGEKVALASFEAVSALRGGSEDIPTEQIAASMRTGEQVATLAGIDVLTIPPKAAAEYLAMEIQESDIRRRRSSDLGVDLDPTRPMEAARISKLWEMDESFVAFVDDAVSQAEAISSGRELVELSAKHGVNLFRVWSNEELRKIREKGKIPDMSQWPGVPVDDLMSISALESFAEDQSALDSRIADLIH